MLEFEFDLAKSAANLAKHGIDFTAAQSIWQDTNRVEVPARTTEVDGDWSDRRPMLVGGGDLSRRARPDHLGTPFTRRGGRDL
jgi:uncharacterized DUF497 family protein